MEKMIITAAITGSVPKKKDTPHVPVTVDEIVEDTLRCEDAGAAIVHLHARDVEQNPSDDPEQFHRMVELLVDRTDLVLQISTGARAGTGLASRIKRLEPLTEMASLTAGSVNMPVVAYVNEPQLVDGLAAEMLKLDIKPEMEVFDTAMIHNSVDLVKRGLAKGPLHFNFLMGLRGAQAGTIDQLVYLRSQLPADATWTVTGIGRRQFPLGIHAVLMGGHVRIGIEDNMYLAKGVLGSNAQLVGRMAELSREIGREIASADDARRILGLSGVQSRLYQGKANKAE